MFENLVLVKDGKILTEPIDLGIATKGTESVNYIGLKNLSKNRIQNIKVDSHSEEIIVKNVPFSLESMKEAMLTIIYKPLESSTKGVRVKLEVSGYMLIGP